MTILSVLTGSVLSIMVRDRELYISYESDANDAQLPCLAPPLDLSLLASHTTSSDRGPFSDSAASAQ